MGLTYYQIAYSIHILDQHIDFPHKKLLQAESGVHYGPPNESTYPKKQGQNRSFLYDNAGPTYPKIKFAYS